MTDARLVLERSGRGKLLERASRFLAFALPAESPDQAGKEIARLRREYHDATHVAFAWKVGVGGAGQRRSSDAGEPAGTAGKRIAAATQLFQPAQSSDSAEPDFPVPAQFISPNLPLCAAIRPSDDQFAGAVAGIASFTADGLFKGQSSQFLALLNQLAAAADAATRQM